MSKGIRTAAASAPPARPRLTGSTRVSIRPALAGPHAEDDHRQNYSDSPKPERDRHVEAARAVPPTDREYETEQSAEEQRRHKFHTPDATARHGAEGAEPTGPPREVMHYGEPHASSARPRRRHALTREGNLVRRMEGAEPTGLRRGRARGRLRRGPARPPRRRDPGPGQAHPARPPRPGVREADRDGQARRVQHPRRTPRPHARGAGRHAAPGGGVTRLDGGGGHVASACAPRSHAAW